MIDQAHSNRAVAMGKPLHKASLYSRYRPYLGVVVPVVLAFIIFYPLFPKAGSEQTPFSFRLPLNLAFIVIAGGGLLWKPRLFFPLLIGLTPLFNMLSTSMALYGKGVDVLYAVIVMATWFMLKPAKHTGHVRLSGLIFASAIILELIGWTMYDAKWIELAILPVRMTTFTILLYAIPKRLDAQLARKTLAGIITGTTCYGLWLLAGVNFAEIFTTRLGLSQHFNPGIVGMYMMMNLMAFVAFSRMNNFRIGLLGVAYMGLALLVIFLSGSRMTYLMVLLFFAYLLIGTPYRRSIIYAAVVGIVVIIPSMQLLIGDVVGMGTRAIDQISESKQFKRSRLEQVRQNIRFNLNELSWRLASENPVFGVGPYNYSKYSYAEGLRPDKQFGYNQGLVSHNSVAGMAAEYGYVGFTLLLLWNLAFLFSPFGRRRLPLFFVYSMVLVNIYGYLVGLFFSFLPGLILCIGIVYSTWESRQMLPQETDTPSLPPLPLKGSAQSS